MTSENHSIQNFADLKLISPIQEALVAAGYQKPTPIQTQAIPIVLAGHDLLGIAQTGTGKTAAFCLPIIQHISEKRTPREPKCPRALILTPTRELAIQIHQNLLAYGKFLRQQKYAVIFGGVGQGNQVRDLQYGTDILVATPGRLLDLIDQRYLKLNKIEVFVLDEADRMLDMGFMRDIRKILPLLPAKRHNLFFSATMPPEIQKLAHSILHEPKKVEVTPPATTVERIKQSVMFVERADKMNLLLHLLKDSRLYKVLVFVEMKHGADKVVDRLQKNHIAAAAIHGNKSQNARQRAIADFTSGKLRVLVATDIASRGIDIDGITHVINFELSNLPESYVHRIGRTARAGSDGEAISLCTSEEKSFLHYIEKTTRQKIPVNTDQPFHSENAANASILSASAVQGAIMARRQQPRGRRGGGGNKRGGSGGQGQSKSRSGGKRRFGGQGRKK